MLQFHFAHNSNTTRLLTSKNLVNNILIEICKQFEVVKGDIDYLYTVDLRLELVIFWIWLKECKKDPQIVEEQFGTSTNDKEWGNKYSNKFIKNKIKAVTVGGNEVLPGTNPSLILQIFKDEILKKHVGERIIDDLTEQLENAQKGVADKERTQGNVLRDFPVYFGTNLNLDLWYWKADSGTDANYNHDLNN